MSEDMMGDTGTQENIVSTTLENADNNVRRTQVIGDSLGAVQFSNAADAKRTLPLTQKPSNEFKETIASLKMNSDLCQKSVLNCCETMTVDRLNVFMSLIIVFIKVRVKKYLTKPKKAPIVKPLLNNIVYFFHMIYTDFKKFNFVLMDRLNYLNNMSDLMAMVIDMEITASKLYACRRCAKKFRTEKMIQQHLEKDHKMPVEGEIESSVYIGIQENEREKLVSVLISSLFIYLDNSTDHILDTMLKMTIKNKKKASIICDSIFSRILGSPPKSMNILGYARHILAFKMWKKMCGWRREMTWFAASLLPAPPHDFHEKVAVFAGILPSVPKKKSDCSITKRCLSNKYKLEEQIQKYLLLINDTAKVSEFMFPDMFNFFSDDRLEFYPTDSVFADDDLDLWAGRNTARKTQVTYLQLPGKIDLEQFCLEMLGEEENRNSLPAKSTVESVLWSQEEDNLQELADQYTFPDTLFDLEFDEFALPDMLHPKQTSLLNLNLTPLDATSSINPLITASLCCFFSSSTTCLPKINQSFDFYKLFLICKA